LERPSRPYPLELGSRDVNGVKRGTENRAEALTGKHPAWPAHRLKSW